MGTRIRRAGAENIYSAAAQWVDRALRDDDSLFTPETSIWSSRWLADLHDRILGVPSNSNAWNTNRLREMLKGAEPEVYQLLGETLYFNLLIGDTPRTKQQQIQNILDLSPTPVAIPNGLAVILQEGIIGTREYHTWRLYHVGFLIEFAERWKRLPSGDHERLLEDAMQFNDYVRSLKMESPLFNNKKEPHRAQLEALLHLVFPDAFEAMISMSHKNAIAKGFAHFIYQPTDDINYKLAQIRMRLELQYGTPDHLFYQTDIKRHWDTSDPNYTPIETSSGDDPTQHWDKGSVLKDLASNLFLPVEFLEDIRWLLEDKKQVIFQGPPGTGKTFVVQALSEYLAGDKKRVKLVQFHPSYAYEDFVQGFRPNKDGGGGFVLRDGPLVRMAKLASDDSSNNYYLIIDEINRGNLGKILGELYFLLEYRGEKADLLYSEEPFSLPSNLYIIGTMNTADRSIALVDLALRRRFYFVEFHPEKAPIKDVLREFLTQRVPNMTWVADVVDGANARLQDEDAAIGPSYFMKRNLDEDMVGLIWEHNVRPYIAERLFGQRGRLAEFDLEKLRNARVGVSSDNVARTGDGEDDAAA